MVEIARVGTRPSPTKLLKSPRKLKRSPVSRGEMMVRRVEKLGNPAKCAKEGCNIKQGELFQRCTHVFHPGCWQVHGECGQKWHAECLPPLEQKQECCCICDRSMSFLVARRKLAF